jgi:alkylated DNA repair dioxygenase AlkB
MEEACRIVEKIVNAEMCKRKRFPLEWGGDPEDPDGQGLTWRANFAAVNCYEGAKEAVGFHSDRLTSIGPYPTIASLSLGTLTL